jgi:hypothetical protein
MTAGLPPSPALDSSISAGQSGHTADHEVIAGTLALLKEAAGKTVAELAASAAFTGAFASLGAPDGASLLGTLSNADEDTAFRIVEFQGTIYVGAGWSQGGANLGGVLYSLNPVSGALTSVYDTGEQSIRSLAVYGKSLYVGTGISGKVFSWDGTTWATAMTGTAGSSIICAAVYDGALYMGETITGKVYKYDGSAWSTALDLTDDHIESLTVFDGLLWVGTGNGAAGYKLYTFDGTSSAAVYTNPDTNKSEALGMAVWRGRLYVSEFDPRGTSVLAEFDPRTGAWSTVTIPSTPTAGYSLAVYRDALYIGSHPDGKLFRYGGGSVVEVADLTGAQSIRDLAVIGDRLYCTTRATGTPSTGGAVHIYGDAAKATPPLPTPEVRRIHQGADDVVGTFDPRIPTTNLNAVANRGYYNRVRIQQAVYVSALRTYIGTSSGNICFAIYDDNGTSGAAGTRLATSGSVASPGTGLRSIALTSGVWLLPGNYWFYIGADNATVAFEALNPSIIMADWSSFEDTYPAPATASVTAGLSGRCYPAWI